MSNTNNPFTRFIHAPNSLNSDKSKYSGYTICYSRSESGLFFAYSLCSKEDNYSKQVGREMSEKVWLSVDHHVMFYGDDCKNSFSTQINPRLRCGFVHVSFLRETLSKQGIFSDQFIQDMTMYDFKHTYMSKILCEFLLSSTIMKKLTKGM